MKTVSTVLYDKLDDEYSTKETETNLTRKTSVSLLKECRLSYRENQHETSYFMTGGYAHVIAFKMNLEGFTLLTIWK